MFQKTTTFFHTATAALFALGLALCGPAEARQTPEAALRDVQAAVDTCDLPRFEQLVAVDPLLDQGLDVLLQRMRTSSSLPPALELMAGALRQNPALEPSLRVMLKDELGKLVRYGIASGRLTGHPKNNVPPQGMLAPFLTDLSTGAKTIKPGGPARPDKTLPQARILPVSIHDAGNGQTYRVHLRMVPNGDSWKVDRVANMADVVARLEKEANAQTSE